MGLKPISSSSATSSVKGSAVDTQKLKTLEMEFRKKVEQLISIMTRKGYHLKVVWEKPSLADHADSANNASSTSRYLTGRAVDIIHRSYGYENTAGNQKYWKDLAITAKGMGLVWGGKASPCHIEAPPVK